MTDVARDDLVRSETNVHVVVLWNCSLCSDKDDDEASLAGDVARLRRIHDATIYTTDRTTLTTLSFIAHLRLSSRIAE